MASASPVISSIPFDEPHLALIDPQPEQVDTVEILKRSGDVMNNLVCGVTLLVDHEVVGFFGAHEMWAGRAFCWAILSKKIGRSGLLNLVRQAKIAIEGTAEEYPRVETTVLSTFIQGHRLINLLGFVEEGVLRKYDSLGRNHVLYSIVR